MTKNTPPLGAQFSIPDNRPVLGADVLAFQGAYRLTIQEARAILGVTNGAWYSMTEEGDKPVKDVAVAIQLLFFADHPEEVPLIPRVDADELIPVLGRTGLARRRWGVLVGRQTASGHRWGSKEQHLSPTASRLGYYLKKEIEAGRLDEWVEKYVEREARNRGVDDVMKVGSFTPAPPHSKDKTSRK